MTTALVHHFRNNLFDRPDSAVRAICVTRWTTSSSPTTHERREDALLVETVRGVDGEKRWRETDLVAWCTSRIKIDRLTSGAARVDPSEPDRSHRAHILIAQVRLPGPDRIDPSADLGCCPHSDPEAQLFPWRNSSIAHLPSSNCVAFRSMNGRSDPTRFRESDHRCRRGPADRTQRLDGLARCTVGGRVETVRDHLPLNRQNRYLHQSSLPLGPDRRSVRIVGHDLETRVVDVETPRRQR